MKSIKEKQLLVKWAKSLNEQVDALILKEVEEYERLQKEVAESLKQKPFIETIPVKTEEVVIKEEKLEEIKEEVIKKTDLITKTVEQITKDSIREESFQQPDPTMVGPDINDIRKKIKFLEQWIAKVSMAGPGGGAGDVINLDFPVKLITNNYTITRKDYYVGVNAVSAVTITLPDSIAFPGRKIIIKDESGNCALNPITVLGNVDNDPGGFILQNNNGGIQLIYREGWRII